MSIVSILATQGFNHSGYERQTIKKTKKNPNSVSSSEHYKRKKNTVLGPQYFSVFQDKTVDDILFCLQHTDQLLAKHWGSLEEKKGVVDFTVYI